MCVGGRLQDGRRVLKAKRRGIGDAMGHGIGSVPTPRCNLLPTLLVSLTYAAIRAVLATKQLSTDLSKIEMDPQPADGLKFVLICAATSRQDERAGKVPLGQRGRTRSREWIVKAVGVAVNSLLNTNWRQEQKVNITEIHHGFIPVSQGCKRIAHEFRRVEHHVELHLPYWRQPCRGVC